MLRVTVDDLDDVVILHCFGRIVRGEETPLLCAAVAEYGRNVIVDLAEVDAIDAAGMGAMVSLQASGIYLLLTNMSEGIREIFRVTGLDSIFEIRETPTTTYDVPDVPLEMESDAGSRAEMGAVTA